MRILHRIALVALWLSACALAPAAHAQRVALVIGNANYTTGRLTNPPNDVLVMEAALKKLNFKVQTLLNANQNQMKRAVRDFGTSAQGAEVAFMYYSGHGTQAQGENYLLPMGASIDKESDYEVEAVSANAVLRQIQGARPKAAIMVLDACRDNPLAATTRSATKGLSRMDAPTGTMIAFATAPNTTASDNGDYAKVLARELQKPGQELIDVFRNTTAEVRRLSAGKQEPRISEMSISDRLYLAGQAGVQLASVRPEATGTPVAPITSTGRPGQAASVSLDDLEKEEATRKEWAEWQARMKADYDKTAAFKGSVDLQAKAWERFLAAWAEDNPTSREDDNLRALAQQRLDEAKRNVQRTAIELPGGSPFSSAAGGSGSIGSGGITTGVREGAPVALDTTFVVPGDTVSKVRATGTLVIGVRDSSGALSYTLGDGQYVGYHVDVCRRIATNLERAIGRRIDVRFQSVTSQNRIPLLQNGTIDIECGSTTNNSVRQRDVSFLTTAYAEEVRIAVRANSGITSVGQLNGRKVAATTGTISLELLRRHERANGVDFLEVFGKDHADSFSLFESGRADAFVMDAQILAGNISTSRNPGDFKIVGEILNVEPVGIMVRKNDAAIKKLGDDTIKDLIRSGEMARIYDKWFIQPIPPRMIRVGLPMNESTRRAWANPNDLPAESFAKQ